METFSWHLTEKYPAAKKIIAYASRSQADIIWIAPLLLLQALLHKSNASLFHLGDLVLAPLARPLKMMTKKPIVVTVHGLEITYLETSKLYHLLITRSLPAIDHFVCVSDNTAKKLQQIGISEKKITIIPHGIDTSVKIERIEAQKNICALIDLSWPDCQNHLVLLSVGRLIKRKGLAWFINNVMPEISELNPLLIITSEGPEKKVIQDIIDKKNLASSVKLVGQVDDQALQQLYHGADIFIMPNIHVENDVEGFGFVGIEAAAAGLPVLAAKIDGIPDAIHHEKNGILAQPEDAAAYIEILTHWHNNPKQRETFAKQAQEYTLQTFQWEKIAKQYETLFNQITTQAKS